MCVYYESLKRELKTKPKYEFQYDERRKTKVEESTRLACTHCYCRIKKGEAFFVDRLFLSIVFFIVPRAIGLAQCSEESWA